MENKNMFASFLFFFVGLVAIAQGDTPPPPPPTPPPPGFPIDGGIVLLFVVAIVYGIYKSYDLAKRHA